MITCLNNSDVAINKQILVKITAIKYGIISLDSLGMILYNILNCTANDM